MFISFIPIFLNIQRELIALKIKRNETCLLYRNISFLSLKNHSEAEIIYFFQKHVCRFIYLVHYITQGTGNKNHYDLQCCAETTTKAPTHRP